MKPINPHSIFIVEKFCRLYKWNHTWELKKIDHFRLLSTWSFKGEKHLTWERLSQMKYFKQWTDNETKKESLQLEFCWSNTSGWRQNCTKGSPAPVSTQLSLYGLGSFISALPPHAPSLFLHLMAEIWSSHISIRISHIMLESWIGKWFPAAGGRICSDTGKHVRWCQGGFYYIYLY